jgi:CBS domain-containing protein
MNVEQIMSRTVETCRTGDNLAIAASKMWDHDVGCLPVLDEDGRLVGMITDRDICMAGYLQGRQLIKIPVSVVMSKQLYACRPEDGLIEAEETMRAHQVRRLPVVNGGGNLVGIISLNDLSQEAERQAGRRARELTGQEVTATLAAVGAPRREAAIAPAP